MGTQSERVVTTPSGRTLCVFDAGAPTGPAVFALHGSPGSGPLFPPHVADAQARGLRLIGYDRPGLGGSSRQPGRSVADCAEDVRTIADALGIERFGLWGLSGGGPHALACAALLADRLAGVGVLCSPAPRDAEGLDYYAGMGEANAEEEAIIAQGPEAHLEWLEAQRLEMLAVDAGESQQVFASLLSPVDAAGYTQELGAYLHASVHRALAPGAGGWYDDSVAFEAPWGFELSAIGVPVQLWHGEHDLFVPLSHGLWLAGHIPGVDARISAQDGHTTMFGRVPEFHAWIAERL